MRRLVALRLIKQEAGYNLLEIIITIVIIGVMAAVSGPNLLDSQRENEAKKAFTEIKGALLEAQANANRMSTTCTVQFTAGTGTYTISGTPSGCVLEPFTIDTEVVSLTKTDFSTALATPADDIAFTFTGTTGDASTLWIARKTFGGDVVTTTAKCVVVSSIGMIRTGLKADTTNDCDNIANDKYDAKN
jgi:prepilin-type N-terminal cleavage/methylation domain-containing protein